jgi:predicted nucleic-acid-binding Zn-ribbon protein
MRREAPLEILHLAAPCRNVPVTFTLDSIMTDAFAHVPKPEDVTSLSYFELVEHLRLSKVNPGHYLEIAPVLQQELAARSPTSNYKCVKCGHTECDVEESRTSRSLLGSMFGVDSAKYTAIVCRRCSYTEFYSGRVSAGEQALDFFVGR